MKYQKWIQFIFKNYFHKYPKKINNILIQLYIESYCKSIQIISILQKKAYQNFMKTY